MGNERLINYLRFAQHRAEIVGSVSTGAFILAAAGLLEGRQATTHPAYAELLQKLGVNYVERDWVEDGRGSSPPQGCREGSTWRSTWLPG